MSEKGSDYQDGTLKQAVDNLRQALDGLKAEVTGQLGQVNARLRKLEAASSSEYETGDNCKGHKPACGCRQCRGHGYGGSPVTWIPIPWINPCWWMTWCQPSYHDTRCYGEKSYAPTSKSAGTESGYTRHPY